MRHEVVKRADQIRKHCDLTCKRADIQQNRDQTDSLKYMDIDSKLRNFFN